MCLIPTTFIPEIQVHQKLVMNFTVECYIGKMICALPIPTTIYDFIFYCYFPYMWFSFIFTNFTAANAKFVENVVKKYPPGGTNKTNFVITAAKWLLAVHLWPVYRLFGLLTSQCYRAHLSWWLINFCRNGDPRLDGTPEPPPPPPKNTEDGRDKEEVVDGKDNEEVVDGKDNEEVVDGKEDEEN